ncbi:MAG: MmcQ/YjbR family DNA-binding protein [Bacilli bacterium]|nr:MmcQ/YjbR family DNA-binding protein [Bacilli bacterium]
MSIENEIFKRSIPNEEKLLEYGFQKKNKELKYEKTFLSSFKAQITVKNDIIEGKVLDMDLDEEYTNFRIENNVGSFANQVREEYQEILLDIREKCFSKKRFISNQANRIADKLKEKYNDEPYFEWKDTPDFGVYKNKNTKKWYGLIMNIAREKIKDGEGKVDVLNIKIDDKKIPELLKKKGFYPAYHMNKKYWITITLDETVEDKDIMSLIEESYGYSEGNSPARSSHEWIVPANPKYYDIESAFQRERIITWKQSSDIKEGDIVYIYVGSPVSALRYKTKALKVNIPYEYQDSNVRMNYIMEIELLEVYDKKICPFSKLKEYGVNAVRGPRFMPKELSDYLNKTKEKEK